MFFLLQHSPVVQKAAAPLRDVKSSGRIWAAAAQLMEPTSGNIRDTTWTNGTQKHRTDIYTLLYKTTWYIASWCYLILLFDELLSLQRLTYSALGIWLTSTGFSISSIWWKMQKQYSSLPIFFLRYLPWILDLVTVSSCYDGMLASK